MPFDFEAETVGQRPQFSDLSQETLRAVSRTAMGSAADVLLDSGRLDSLNLKPEVQEWAENRLDAAITSWDPNKTTLANPLFIEMNGRILSGVIPQLEKKLTKLYKEAEATGRSDEMDILLVPYGDFSKHVKAGTFGEWLALNRAMNGYQRDAISETLTNRFYNNQPYQYDDDQSPGFGFGAWLDHQKQSHGNWGLLVVDQKTAHYNTSLETIRRHKAGQDFGVAEWLALTIQQGRGATKPGESLLLPGSNFVSAAGEFVVSGYYNDEENHFGLELLPASGKYPNRGFRPLLDPTRS